MSLRNATERLAARVMRVLGNDVVIDGVSGKGQLMAPTERIIDGNVITTGWELKYQMIDYPAIQRGSVVVVDGVTFTAREDGIVTGDAAVGVLLLQSEEDPSVAGSGWRRPRDWLAISQLTAADNRFVGLYAVPPSGSVVALSAAGAYTVNWGDGVTENFAANAVAEHSYTFADADLGAATSEGWKQAIISLTMQAGQTFTLLDLHRRHSSITTTTQAAEWRQLRIAGGAITSLSVSVPASNPRSATIPFTGTSADVVKFENLALIGLWGTTSLEDHDQLFARLAGLRLAENYSCANATPTRHSCTLTTGTNLVTQVAHGKAAGKIALIYESGTALDGLHYFVVNPSADTYQLAATPGGAPVSIPSSVSALVTYGAALYGTFYGCSRLQRLPSFPAAGIVSLFSVADECGLIVSQPLIGDTSNCIQFNSVFWNCRQLKTVATHDTSQGRYFGNLHSGNTALSVEPSYDFSNALQLNAVYGSPLHPALPMTLPRATTMIRWRENTLLSQTWEYFATPALTNGAGFFRNWRALRACSQAPDTALNTNFNDFFSGCGSLDPVPSLDKSAGTSANSMYLGVRAAIPADKPWTVLTQANFMFSGYLGSALPSHDTSLWQNISSLLLNCVNVTTTPAWDFSGVTTAGAFMSGCSALVNTLFTGLKVSHSYTGTAVDRTNMEAIFTRLGRAASSQTLTITSTPAALNNVAVSKPSCTTTLNSTTVNVSDTSNLAVGQEVSGTGISTAVAVTFTDAGDLVTNGTRPAPPNGTLVWFNSVATSTFPGLPSPATFMPLYVVNRSGSTFQVSQTIGGAAEVITTNGTGTMSYGSYIQSIITNTSFTLDVAASAAGTVTLTARSLNTAPALARRFTIAG